MSGNDFNFFSFVFDFILHIDRHLGEMVQEYRLWTYFILFLIVFCETGLVVTPFLPGDSLLFAAGSIAAIGYAGSSVLDPNILFILLSVAAILGDTVNYWLGHYIGPKAFKEKSRFLKKEYLDKTHAFYEKHGGKTIILARFIPIIRTFAPFVAGIGAMSYGKFIAYNIIGGVAWVAIFVYAGYFFGSHPLIQKNFSLVIIAIVFISILPIIFEFMKRKRAGRALPD
jgi:membrane-associated protein